MAVPNRVYCSSTSGNKLFFNDLEVFSTDGTIKYELLKKGLLVNGQLQVLPKVIVGTALAGGGSAGGVRVDWGNGDVDILTGQTWNTSGADFIWCAPYIWYETNFSPAIRRRWAYLGRSNLSPSTITSLGGAEIGLTGCATPENWSINPTVVQARLNAGLASENPQWVFGNKVNPVICGTQVYSSASVTLFDNISNTQRTTANISSLGRVVAAGNFRRYAANTTLWVVETNTGDTSSRTQRFEPDVSLIASTPCSLTVTFEDNTTQVFEYDEDCPSIGTCNTSILINETEEINLSRCISPDSVQITCGKNCPEGTCLKIRCGNTVCCYGNSGEVIKSIFDPEREIKEDC